MEFKKLLPILFTVGMLAGCTPAGGGGTQPGGDTDDGKHKIEIVNKDEMEADWMVGDATRLLKLNLTDDGVVKSDIAEVLAKKLTITIADSKVVTNNALTFTAMGEGTTTVALKYYGTQKSFTIKVVHRPTNKELYGTAHEGNAADPFNNEDALKIAKAQKQAGSFTTDKYYFAGTVDSFYHAPGSRTDKVCSWFMTPATAGGERFEIYKCTITDDGATTNRQWTEDDIWKGAGFVCKGNLAEFNGQYETGGAELISVSGTKPEVHTIEATVAQALTAGKALSDGDSTVDTYNITGYVVKKDGNNYFLADTKEAAADDKDMFEVYFSAAPSAEITDKLLKNAKVKISGIKVKNYHGQIETTASPTKDDIAVLEAGEAWVTPAGEVITVAQALAKAKAVPTPSKEDFGTATNKSIDIDSGKLYEITGIVVEKGTWSTQYNNADFWIGDTAETAKADALQVFRCNDKTLFDALVVGTTSVKVTSKLVAFFKLVENVPTFAAVETAASPACEIVSGGDTPAATVITVAQAIALCKAVAVPSKDDFGGKNNKTVAVSETVYEITGIVIEKGTWSTQYKNADFWIGDTAETAKADALQVFRIGDETLFNSLTVGTTQVKVTCTLAAFFKLENDVPTFSAAETNQNPTVAVVGGEGGEGGEGGGGEQATITLTPGTNGSAAVVKVGGTENPAVKVGTGSKAGDMTISGIPATAKKVTFHGAAWKAKTAVLTVSATNATVDKTEVTLVADDGISNNTPFTLAGSEATFVVELNLTNVTGEVSITLATTDTANGRFVVWGVTAE